MKLDHISKIEGIIACVGNLHIGGSSKDAIEIGGLDNPVIRHPLTGEPYIPGSSLKGKMRCSLERAGFAGERTSPQGVCICGKPTCQICVVFGSMYNGKSGDPLGPTRLIVRDAALKEDSREKFKKAIDQDDQDYTGIKYENVISRTTGVAKHPRPIEFVPAGTDFELKLSLLVYDVDEGKNYLDLIKKALCAVEDTYLGGLGSRGYGQVEFQKLTLDGKDFPIRKGACAGE